MDATSALLIAIIVVIVVVALYFAGRGRSTEQEFLERIPLGTYLAGLPGVNERKESVACGVAEGAYTLVTDSGSELGRIPRNGIIDIFYEEKPQLLQRLTATKSLSFAAFGLDKSKGELQKDYCVVIDWDDTSGTRHNTIFEFSGIAATTLAHKAVQSLKLHQKPHIPRLRPDEKKCPYCAEIIKKEALICRYCNNRI